MFHSVSTMHFPTSYYLEKNVYCFCLVSEPRNQLFVQLHSIALRGEIPFSQKWWDQWKAMAFCGMCGYFLPSSLVWISTDLTSPPALPQTSLNWCLGWGGCGHPGDGCPQGSSTQSLVVPWHLLVPPWEPHSILTNWALDCVHQFPMLVICLSGL